MRKIFESRLYGYLTSETSERIYVYELESDDEYNELYSLTYEELCARCNVVPSGIVAPGDFFYKYYFQFESKHLVMTEIIGKNI